MLRSRLEGVVHSTSLHYSTSRGSITLILFEFCCRVFAGKRRSWIERSEVAKRWGNKSEKGLNLGSVERLIVDVMDEEVDL